MHRLYGIALLALIASVTLVPPARGRTWIVDGSGGGDFRLVSEGCAAAADGDTVAIAPGDYNEYSGSDSAITMDSISVAVVGLGAEPEDTQLCLRLRPEYGGDILIENVTFHDEYRPIYSLHNESTTVRKCRFENNHAGDMAGAIFSTDGLVLGDCVFYRNVATTDISIGGAIYGRCHATRCSFIENESGEHGGAVRAVEGSEFRDCLFLRNVSYNGAALTSPGLVSVVHCTFWGNRTTWSQGAAVEIGGILDPFEDCIIGGTVNGYGVGCWVPLTLFCLCFWQNDRGMYAGDCGYTPAHGVFEADPLFCDLEHDDFTLRADSPCLPGIHGGQECGRLGAFDAACGFSPAVPTSWGRIKSLYLNGSGR